jgi:hypothetical protein
MDINSQTPWPFLPAESPIASISISIITRDDFVAPVDGCHCWTHTTSWVWTVLECNHKHPAWFTWMQFQVTRKLTACVAWHILDVMWNWSRTHAAYNPKLILVWLWLFGYHVVQPLRWKMHDFRKQNTVYIYKKINSTKVEYSMIARQPLKCTGSMNFACRPWQFTKCSFVIGNTKFFLSRPLDDINKTMMIRKTLACVSHLTNSSKRYLGKILIFHTQRTRNTSAKPCFKK